MIYNLMKEPLTLRLYPDSVLREISQPVRVFDATLRKFCGEMLIFMKRHGGIGLAAPQIGLLRRIVVAEIGETSVCLVNPVIVARSGIDRLVEGCLSLPGYKVKVERNISIEIHGNDLDGEESCFTAEGLMARVLQHEVDHLNGLLICDHDVAITDGHLQDFQSRN